MRKLSVNFICIIILNSTFSYGRLGQALILEYRFIRTITGHHSTPNFHTLRYLTCPNLPSYNELNNPRYLSLTQRTEWPTAAPQFNGIPRYEKRALISLTPISEKQINRTLQIKPYSRTPLSLGCPPLK